VLRWIGGFVIKRLGEPQSNDFHRCSTDLDGVSEEYASAASTIGIANSWSWMLWLKPKPMALGEAIAQIAPATGFANNIRLRAGAAAATDLRFDFHDSAGTHILDTTVSGFFTNNEWICTTITWDGSAGTLTIYGNGVQKSQTLSLTAVMTDTRRVVALGGNVGGTNTAPMRIHSAAIWDKALTADEVRAVFNHGSGSSFDLNRSQDGYFSSANLVHWWRLGLNIASLGADSGSGGIDVAAAAVGITTADIVRDAPDGAYVDYDGVGEYHHQATPSTFGFGASSSIAVWCKINAATASTVIVDFSDATVVNKNRHMIWLDGSSFLSYFVSDAAAAFAQPQQAAAARTGEWYHVVGVKDGVTAARIYINGELIGSDTTSVPVTDNSGRVGAFGTNARTADAGLNLFNGQIHSVAMWDVALTGPEIVSLYNGGHKEFDPRADADSYASSGSLKHWWRVGQPARAGQVGDDTVVDEVSTGGINMGQNSVGLTHSQDVKVASAMAQGVSTFFDGATQAYNNITGQLYGFANSWTVSAWANTNQNTANGVVLDLRGRILVTYRGANAGDPIRVGIVDSQATTFKTYEWNGLLTIGVWSHLAVTWDGTNLLLYHNGQAVAPTTKVKDNAGATADVSSLLGIGGFAATGGFWFGGSLGAYAIWGSVLSPDEIVQVYSMGQSGDLQNATGAYISGGTLKHWWKFGEDPASIGRDFVATGGVDAAQDAMGGLSHAGNIFGITP